MKFRSIFFLLSQVCALSLLAMSPNERTEFKKDLEAALTSDQVQVLIEGKRPGKRLFTLEFSNTADKAVAFVRKYNDDPGEDDVLQAVEECFFQEMEPYLFQGGDIDVVKAKFEKYAWANQHVVREVAAIFFAQESRATGPDDLVKKYTYIKARCGQLTGHTISQASFSSVFLHKAFESIEQHKIKLRLLVSIAALCIIYYCWTQKSDEKNNQSEAIQNGQDIEQNHLDNVCSSESV